MTYIGRAVRLAEAQAGLPYIFAHEEAPTDPTPEAFDCSELVEWIDHRVGPGKMPDGSMNQRDHCRPVIDIGRAIRTRGALLFRDPRVTGTGHVAISRGNGTTIEARGSAFGVGVFTADRDSRLWTSAALWPGFEYEKKEKIELVTRWVVFGPSGGRVGGVRATSDDPMARRVMRLLREAHDRHPHRPALVLKRAEPRDLEDFDDVDAFPRWVADKIKRRAA